MSSKQKRIYTEEQKAHKAAWQKEWKARNREKIREQDKEYRAKHIAERREYNRQWTADNPEARADQQRRAHAKMCATRRALLYEGKECSKCGAAKRLDYHHVDPATKELHIGGNIGVSMERLEAEIAKCIILCRSCHLTHHRNEENGDV